MQDIHEGLDFATGAPEESPFGIWSLKFSHDGRELVAGTSNRSIYVYDLEANEPTFRVTAHEVTGGLTQWQLVSSSGQSIYQEVGKICKPEMLSSTGSSFWFPSCLKRARRTNVWGCVLDVQDDVNAVAFADNSSHLIYSGSDDNFCKVLLVDEIRFL